MDDMNAHADNGDTVQPSTARPRRSFNSKAIPYGSDDMASFFSDEWDTSWEINHTVVPPRAVAG
jgi:hypothetical protein